MLLIASLLLLTTTKVSALTIIEEAGWLETAYATWQPVEGASSYAVYYSGEGMTNQKADDCLVRQYADYYRVDIPGLKAGSYTLTIEAQDENG